MAGALPFSSGFTLSADALPERLFSAPKKAAFALPGAQDLSAFADLLGQPEEEADAPNDAAASGAPFSLPAMLPEDVSGPAALSREIDFSQLTGDSAVLSFDLLCGRGSVYLGETKLADFDRQPLALDLTDALHLGRRQTLSIRFDETRPAGVCGPILLHTARYARLDDVTAVPDMPAAVQPASRTVTVRAKVRAFRSGLYRLLAQPCPSTGAQAAAHPLPAREITLTLEAGQTHDVLLTLCVPGECFTPGKPYAAPAVKLQLFTARIATPSVPEKKRGFFARKKSVPAMQPARAAMGSLCDCKTLMIVYPGKAPHAFVPLTAEECTGDPDALIKRLTHLHVQAVALPAAAPDILRRALAHAGVAALPHPARMQEAVSPELSAWQMCSMTGTARTPDPGVTCAELLRDAAGFPVDPHAQSARDVLAWLRAVSVRLRAEAARQGRLEGAFCAPGEWNLPDVEEALCTALAPVHLSALPLLGAWWTGSRFSASLCALIEPQALPAAVRQSSHPLRVQAMLEDEESDVLARLDADCPAKGGEIGVLEAALPDAPCVLTLITRILCGDAVVEQSSMPVYVGERGQLEAAFRP